MNSPCWEWPENRNADGYGVFKKQLVHRLIYAMFVSVIPPGACVLHRCDNRSCVNPQHLFLGTQQDNLVDMRAKGRGAYGEKHGGAKLTANQVKSIIQDPRLLQEIADEYGISEGTASIIKNRKSWKHLEEQ